MTRNSISQESLKNVLSYNPDNGIFIWINSSRPGWNGKQAGSINPSTGYHQICLNHDFYQTGRLAWLYVHGDFPESDIDHISRDKTDNSIANLRPVTRRENCKNLSKRTNNVSGVTGVGWQKEINKWRVRITVNYKSIYVGVFSDFQEACDARKEANVKYGFAETHGE